MKNIISKIFLIIILSVGLQLSSYSQENSNNSDNLSQIITNYELVIYPNPVTDNKFFVKSKSTIKSVEVLNVIGQSIMIVNNTTGIAYNIPVELPPCEKGMYMVKIIFKDSKTSIKKIFIK